MKKHGGIIYEKQNHILDFSANIHPNGMPEEVEEAMKTALRESVCYPDPDCRKLKQCIADKWHVSQEHIICGNGAVNLIYQLAFVLNARKLLLPIPAFLEYEEAFLTISKGNLEIEEYRIDQKEFKIQEDFLERIEESVDIIALCNPNNPTGQLIDHKLLERIVELAAQKNVFLLLDECFLDFVMDGEELSYLSKYQNYPNLFLLKSFTKMYGIPGIRLGYGICANTDLIKKMRQAAAPWSVSHVAQAAGIAACSLEQYEKKSAMTIRDDRDRLIKQLGTLGFQVWDGSANYLFFRAKGCSNLYQLCMKHGICIRRCGNYRGLTDDYYRIAIRKREENEQLIRVLRNMKEGGEI